MVFQGVIENGVIAIPAGLRLADGQAVTVQTSEVAPLITHSVLDIAPVSLGGLLKPFSDDDDILEEMLDGRA